MSEHEGPSRPSISANAIILVVVALLTACLAVVIDWVMSIRLGPAGLLLLLLFGGVVALRVALGLLAAILK